MQFVRSIILLAGLILAGPVAADLRMDVAGGDDGLRDALDAASRLARIEAPSQAVPQDVIAAARSDYSRLVAVLYERGYFGPTISIRLDGQEAADISPFRAPGPVRDVLIRIDPGTPFRLNRAEISPLAPGTALPEGFVPGAVAGTPVLRRAAEAGVAGWRNQGHSTAAIADQQIIARHAQAQLDVMISLDPGPVTSFGDLIPEGQQNMRPDRIRAIAGLPRGARFDPDTLERVAGRLRDAGVFNSVTLTEEDPDAGDVVDITASLVEAPLRRLGFGAEISAREGVGLSAYWLHRNLFGGAERLRLEAEASGLGGENGGFDARAAATYTRPAFLTPDTALTLGLEVDHADEVRYTEDGLTLSAGLDHRLSDTLSASIGVELGHSRITDAFSRRTATILSLPATMTYDSRDTAQDATEGWFLQAGLAPFTVVDNGGGGLRSTFDARGYLGLGDGDRTRIAARLQGGSVSGASIASLPPEWLFFSGGATTVRGQAYQSLGALQGGVATGGRSVLAASLELRQDIIGDWGAVAFADTGYVTRDAYWSGASAQHSGAGIGLRYDTPIGPIRFDLATPISGAGRGQDLFFYIGIGQAF